MKQFGANRIHEGSEPAVGGYQCNFWVPASEAERPALLSKIRSFLKDIGVNDNECDLDWYDDSHGMSTGPQESYHINESINALGAHIRENTPLAMRHEFHASYNLQHGYDLFMRAARKLIQHLNYYKLICASDNVRVVKEDVEIPACSFHYALDGSSLSSVQDMIEYVFRNLAKLSPEAASFDIKVYLVSKTSIADAISKEFNHAHADDGVHSTVNEDGNLCISVVWEDEDSLDATAASILKKAAFAVTSLCGILSKMGARQAFGYDRHAYPNIGSSMQESRHEFPGCHDTNSVSGSLPPDIDSFLQDMAQITRCISYGDIMNFGERATREDVRALRKIYNEVEEDAEYGDDPSNDAQARVAAIVKGL